MQIFAAHLPKVFGSRSVPVYIQKGREKERHRSLRNRITGAIARAALEDTKSRDDLSQCRSAYFKTSSLFSANTTAPRRDALRFDDVLRLRAKRMSDGEMERGEKTKRNKFNSGTRKVGAAAEWLYRRCADERAHTPNLSASVVALSILIYKRRIILARPSSS